jgi:hypothetical protein
MPATAVLIFEGFQLPVIAVVLVELVGKFGAIVFKQIGPNCAKVGVVLGAFISISTVVIEAHWPASGVKV